MSVQLKARGARDPAVRAWLRLFRVFHKVDRMATNEMRIHGLTMAQFDVLARVGMQGGMTQQELADSLLVTKGNVCQLLDRMESGGMIRRQQQGRSNCLFLTPEGERLFAQVVPEHEGLIEQAFSTLTPAEQLQLLHLLRKLERGLTSLS